MLRIIVGLGVHVYSIYANFLLTCWLYNLHRCSELVARYAYVGIDGDGKPHPTGSVDITGVVRNVLLVCLFAVQHSGMARQTTKKLLTRLLPFYMERTVYILCTSLVLHLIASQWTPLPMVLYELAAPWSYIVWAVSIVGLIINVSATFMTGYCDLLGLRQVFMGKNYTQPPFIVRYLYKYVRNPIQFGGLVYICVVPTMTVGRLVFCLCIVLHMLLALPLSEKDLEQAEGKKYQAYKKAVPMLIPSLTPYSPPQVD